ncbi:cofilin-like isoform X2 [Mizuhopecten yessoensis]|uniref:cofilin-like isoform X2 n=1 Tax=Mizuhopecten yessoensis TaxID=6573 RepID=UPI000B45ED15|nr:cofilin-like isoform X2 [Mizuhopecten yessoensis]
MSSGVAVDDQCLQVFEEMKLGHKWSYVVYKITDDKKRIVVDTKAADRSYDDFKQILMNASNNGLCRYGVFDVKFTTRGDQVREKLAFFHWSPDSCKTMEKMLYSSSLKELKSKLKGVHTEIQANDEDDLALSNVLDRCTDKYT